MDVVGHILQQQLDVVQVPPHCILVGGVQHSALTIPPAHHFGDQVQLVTQEVLVLDPFLKQTGVEGEEGGDGQNHITTLLPGQGHETSQVLQQVLLKLQVSKPTLPVQGQLQEGAASAVGPQHGQEGQDICGGVESMQRPDQGLDGMERLLQLLLPAMAVLLAVIVHLLQVMALTYCVGQLVHALLIFLNLLQDLQLRDKTELALLCIVPADGEGETTVDKECYALRAKPAGHQVKSLVLWVPAVVGDILHLEDT